MFLYKHNRTKMIEPEFFNVKNFAKLLDISPQTVRLWIKEGKIKAIKISEGARANYRIPKTEIMRIRACAYEDVE